MEGAGDRPTICLFGGHDPGHSRVVNLRRALEDAGFPVVEVQSRATGALRRGWELLRGFLRRGRDADVLLVGMAGQRYVFLARPLAWLTGQRLVLDAFISHYLVLVEDAREPRGRLGARALRMLDRWACRLADRVLLDTPEHVRYFVDQFRIEPRKFRVVRLGADESVFRPAGEGEGDADRGGAGAGGRRVLYYGSFFPLQGAPLIARAARRFAGGGTTLVLAGEGPEKAETMRILEEGGVQGVEDHGWVDREAIGELIRGADVCLGHFGMARQADLVVPFKIYEVLASGRPLVMGRARPVERLLEHGREVWFCERGSSDAIARAVRTLLDDPELRRRLAREGRRRFESLGGREVLAEQATRALLGPDGEREEIRQGGADVDRSGRDESRDG